MQVKLQLMASTNVEQMKIFRAGKTSSVVGLKKLEGAESRNFPRDN